MNNNKAAKEIEVYRQRNPFRVSFFLPYILVVVVGSVEFLLRASFKQYIASNPPLSVRVSSVFASSDTNTGRAEVDVIIFREREMRPVFSSQILTNGVCALARRLGRRARSAVRRCRCANVDRDRKEGEDRQVGRLRV